MYTCGCSDGLLLGPDKKNCYREYISFSGNISFIFVSSMAEENHIIIQILYGTQFGLSILFSVDLINDAESLRWQNRFFFATALTKSIQAKFSGLN